MLGIKSKSIVFVTILIFLHQVMVAIRDALAEGLMVVISKEEDEENIRKYGKDHGMESSSRKYVNLIFTLRFVGTLSSSYLAGVMLKYMDPHQVLFYSFIIPSLCAL